MRKAVAQRVGFAIMDIALFAMSMMARQTGSEPGPVFPESRMRFPMEARCLP